MLTFPCPPISLWGLQDTTNKPHPSPPLAGQCRGSWCFCSHDLLGKRKQEQNISHHCPPCDWQHHLHMSWHLPKHRKVRGSKHRARFLQIPGESASNTKMSIQLCNITTDHLCHPELLSTLQKKNTPKRHDRALLQQIINHYTDTSLFCGEKVICQYNCLNTGGNACFISYK